jgi:hypothetical protein
MLVPLGGHTPRSVSHVRMTVAPPLVQPDGSILARPHTKYRMALLGTFHATSFGADLVLQNPFDPCSVPPNEQTPSHMKEMAAKPAGILFVSSRCDL